jgi:hypothetical protein
MAGRRKRWARRGGGGREGRVGGEWRGVNFKENVKEGVVREILRTSGMFELKFGQFAYFLVFLRCT